MANIALIDDDVASELLADALRCRGLDVKRFASPSDAMAAIDFIASADAIILDLIMELRDADADVPHQADRNRGIEILNAIRAQNKDVPVIVFSASTDSAVRDALEDIANTEFVSKWNSPSIKEFLRIVEGALGIHFPMPGPASFIVHGHDDAAKLDLKNYLQNTLHLPEPIILHEQPNLGRTIIEKFESYASASVLAFVLLTPDDPAADPNSSNNDKRRARQNVIFEMGIFWDQLVANLDEYCCFIKG
jgi:CheY-like chemotaxis protein